METSLMQTHLQGRNQIGDLLEDFSFLTQRVVLKEPTTLLKENPLQSSAMQKK
jgi:hypothetical protein